MNVCVPPRAVLTFATMLLTPLIIFAQTSSIAVDGHSKTTDAKTVSAQQDFRPQLRQRPQAYLIQASDVLEITFDFTPEFNQQVVVQPDGDIRPRGLSSSIRAEGLSLGELVDNLQKAYGAILKNPSISASFKDFDKPAFVAGGLVSKPGKYELRGTITATQAIAIAGGFAEGAKPSQVMLFRKRSDEWVETKSLNLDEILKGKKFTEDVILQPGDMLFVPKSFMGKIDKYLPRTSLGTYFTPGNF